MSILAFDTATAACSAAVWHAGTLVAHRYEARVRGHAERLMPMVQAVMAEAGLDYRGLAAIAVTVGPGTFSGLRIGLAAARGLALAADRPLIGVSTLEALAHGVPAELRAGRPVLAALDARRGQVYAQAFGPDLAPLDGPVAVSAADIAAHAPSPPLVLAGNGAALVRARLDGAPEAVRIAPGDGLPDAAVVARIAAARDRGAPGWTVAPLYLREPGANRP